MSDQQVRIGDAEREQAAATLGEHFAQGRLTLDEHAERLDRIWAARTNGDLEPVFRDLPGHRSRPAVPRVPSNPWPGGLRAARRRMPGPLVLILAILVVFTVVTHLPLILIGLLLFWVFSSRRHRWHARS